MRLEGQAAHRRSGRDGPASQKRKRRKPVKAAGQKAVLARTDVDQDRRGRGEDHGPEKGSPQPPHGEAEERQSAEREGQIGDTGGQRRQGRDHETECRRIGPGYETAPPMREGGFEWPHGGLAVGVGVTARPDQLAGQVEHVEVGDAGALRIEAEGAGHSPQAEEQGYGDGCREGDLQRRPDAKRFGHGLSPASVGSQTAATRILSKRRYAETLRHAVLTPPCRPTRVGRDPGLSGEFQNLAMSAMPATMSVAPRMRQPLSG